MRCSAPQSALSPTPKPGPAHNLIGIGSGHCPQRQSQGLPCGFAKQTKKGEKPRGELARTFGFNPFFLYCRVIHAANLHSKRRFSVSLLTQKRNVLPPSSPSSPFYTSSLPSHSFTRGTPSSFATVGAMSRMEVSFISAPFSNFGPQMHTGISISSGISVPWLRS